MSTSRNDNAAARKRLAEIPGIGNTLAAKLVRRGFKTKAQLRAIIDELPRETQAHLRYNIARAIPATVAKSVTDELKRRLTFEAPTGRRRKYSTIAVGSVRRGAPQSKDLDVLVVVPDESHLAGLLASAELSERGKGAKTLSIAESYASGERRRSFVVRRAPRGGRPKYYAVDLFLATDEEKPYALFHYTGGRDYNIRVRAHAKRSGYVLNQYGLFCAGSKGSRKRRAPSSKSIRTERDLMQYLGVTYRAPKDRSTA